MALPLVLDAAQWQQTLELLATDGTSLSAAGLCLVDVRSAEAYAQGHLPGAVHVNPALLSRSEPPFGGLLPEPDAVNEFLRMAGVRMGDHIVVYDGGLETPAARLVWVLDAYGYEVCSWLNGGYKAWTASQLPVTTEPATAQAGTLSLSLIGDNVISVDELLPRLNDPDMQFIDVRSTGEFIGQDVRAAFGGHIPGAHHSEWTSWLDEHGCLLDDDTLLQRLNTMGIQTDASVLTYCQTHQRSSVTYIALRHLGFDNALALDGAWSSWGNREDTPKELGQA